VGSSVQRLGSSRPLNSVPLGGEGAFHFMRIRNLSTKRIPSELWHHLAHTMQLGDRLPMAVADELELYPKHYRLEVTVRPIRRHAEGVEVFSGYYSCGRVVIFPCPSCTSAFLTHLFLHELFHAWIDQYHNTLYASTMYCDLTGRFADASFRALGGRVRPRNVCGSYSFSKSLSFMLSTLGFPRLFKSLSASSSGQLQKWIPDSLVAQRLDRSPKRPMISRKGRNDAKPGCKM